MNIEMTNKEGITLLTAGKYCTENIEVVPAFTTGEENKLAQVVDRTVTEITVLDLAGATKIGKYAFQGCTALVSINIPNGVTSIEYGAFQNCSALASIEIPDSVTSIASYAVSNCKKLIGVSVNATTPPILETYAFNNISSDAVIYVPAESVEAYKSATNWSTYANKIFGMNELTLNTQAELVNNEEYQYSLDGGQTWSVFKSETISLSDVALIMFKNLNKTDILLIGKTAGAKDIKTIINNEFTYAPKSSMTIYLSLQEMIAKITALSSGIFTVDSTDRLSVGMNVKCSTASGVIINAFGVRTILSIDGNEVSVSGSSLTTSQIPIGSYLVPTTETATA